MHIYLPVGLKQKMKFIHPIKSFFMLYILSMPTIVLKGQNIQYVLPPTSKYTHMARFSENMARVTISFDSTGFIDTSGKSVMSFPYSDAGNFHDGLAWVKREIDGADKYGYINTSGTLVIPFMYDEVEDFSCNRAAVQKNAVWCYINKNGKAIIGDSLLITEMPIIGEDRKEQTEDVEPPAFVNNLALYRDTNNLYGFIDTSAQKVFPAKYYAATNFSGGIALVAADTVKATQLTGNNTLTKFYNSLPPGNTEYIWSIIDTSGKTVRIFNDSLRPDVTDVVNGFVSVSLRGDDWSTSYGVVNKNGNVIIPPNYYNSPQGFSEGIGLVQVDGKAENNKDGYLLTFDSTGKILGKIPLLTSSGTIYDSGGDFHEGLLAVKIGDKWGYTDVHGKIIIPPLFDTALNFSDGLAIVVTADGQLAVIKNPLNE